MTDWLILACFIGIAIVDYKKHIIPDVLIVIIVLLALLTRTRIEFYEHLIYGAVACAFALVLFWLKKSFNFGWSAGDVKLFGVVGLVFGPVTPWVMLGTGIWLIAAQKAKGNVPYGVPVAVGSLIALLITV